METKSERVERILAEYLQDNSAEYLLDLVARVVSNHVDERAEEYRELSWKISAVAESAFERRL